MKKIIDLDDTLENIALSHYFFYSVDDSLYLFELIKKLNQNTNLLCKNYF